MEWVYDDGGRKAAGYKGHTGDCACRAIAIVTGMAYQDAYDAINEAALKERPRGKTRRSNARTGVWPKTVARILGAQAWVWVPTMTIGSGTRVHLRADELPPGRLIARVTRHYTAVVDGVIHDTGDPSREGTRAVYGVWLPPDTPRWLPY